MKWSLRTAQWIIALHRAKQRPPWFRMAWALLTGAVPRSVWRERMRFGCYQCPIFDHQFLVCRGAIEPWNKYGCDCYVVFSAMTANPYGNGCWGRTHLGQDYGWGPYRPWWRRLLRR